MTKLLIVDDKRENQYMLQVLLSTNGYEVELASNGAEALDRAHRTPPDLIVSDILMPVMDGFALCRAWKKDEQLKYIPFIFYTATYTDPKDEIFALSLGANQFLVKPLEPDKFLAALREAIESRKTIQPPSSYQPTEEVVYYKEYNEALIRKLEDKVSELEITNHALEQELVNRNRAEHELQENERQMRFISENLADAMVYQINSGPDGKLRQFTYISPAVEQLHEIKIEEAKADPTLIYNQVMKSHQSLLAQAEAFAVKNRTTMDVDLKIQTPSGKIRWRRLISTPFIREDGCLVWNGIELDITDRMELEEQLHQAQKMESVGRLAGGIAHDFNNILGVILGNTELAMMRIEPTNPILTNLEDIKKAALSSSSLTRQLLAFARKQTVVPVTLDLNETVENMLKMLRRLIGENIQVHWQPQPDLWLIKMDPSQIDQILANLCVNARDAISNIGQITIETGNTVFDESYTAHHAGYQPGEYAMLAVSDNGCGMDKNVLDHIFEPFFTTKDVGKGTGLGLATVYGIVKQNEGFINVYSEPGQGTTLKIYLPRLKGGVIEPAPATPTEISMGHGETVLLVDNDKAILKVSQAMLEKLGYKVLPADGPGEAIRLAKEHAGKIQLLITDIVMPEMNGRDLSNMLCDLYPGLKCLFSSGYPTNVVAHQGILDRGVYFLQKPFSMKDLATKVRQVMEPK